MVPSTILHTADTGKFYPKPMVPMESRDSEGVPFARLESLYVTRHLGEAPEGCRKVVTYVTITKIENLHINMYKNSLIPKMLFFDLRRKHNEVITGKKHFRTVASPGARGVFSTPQF